MLTLFRSDKNPDCAAERRALDSDFYCPHGEILFYSTAPVWQQYSRGNNATTVNLKVFCHKNNTSHEKLMCGVLFCWNWNACKGSVIDFSEVGCGKTFFMQTNKQPTNTSFTFAALFSSTAGNQSVSTPSFSDNPESKSQLVLNSLHSTALRCPWIVRFVYVRATAASGCVVNCRIFMCHTEKPKIFSFTTETVRHRRQWQKHALSQKLICSQSPHAAFRFSLNVCSGLLKITVFTFSVHTVWLHEADKGDVMSPSIPNSRRYVTRRKAAEELSLWGNMAGIKIVLACASGHYIHVLDGWSISGNLLEIVHLHSVLKRLISLVHYQ